MGPRGKQWALLSRAAHRGGSAAARSAVLLLATLLVTPALAQGILPFTGVFGNASGCVAYATGRLAADYLLLTPDTFASATLGCDFESLARTDEPVFTVAAVCSPGGRATVRIIDHGADGFGVAVDGRGTFGPLAACPGTGTGDGVHL